MAALAGRTITALLFRTPCEGRFYHSVTSPAALAAISHAPNTPRRFYTRNTTIHDLRLSTLPIQYHHRAGVVIDLWTRTRAGYPDSPVFTFCPASFKRALLYFLRCLSYILRIGRSTQHTRFSLRSVLGRSQFVHYTRWSQPHGAGAGGLFIILSPLFSYMICRCMGSMRSRVPG